MFVSPYSWLPEYTAKCHWLGGHHGGGGNAGQQQLLQSSGDGATTRGEAVWSATTLVEEVRVRLCAGLCVCGVICV